MKTDIRHIQQVALGTNLCIDFALWARTLISKGKEIA
jgi:hypothetical protein